MDLRTFLQCCLQYKKRIGLIIFTFLFLGILYVLLTPKSFKAETLLLPESGSSSSLGGLSQLASAIPGLGSSFSMGSSGSDAIRPEFYPTIIQSTPFINDFINYTFYHPDFKDSVNLMTYGQKYAPNNHINTLKKYTIGAPGLIISLIRNLGGKSDKVEAMKETQKDSQGFFRPTVGDFLYMKAIKEIVNVSIDKKTGIIKISVQTTNPVLSAYLTEFTRNYLVNYVTDYKKKKQQHQTEFLAARNEELEKRFLLDQSELAGFKERNFNINSSFLQDRLENLTAKYELSKSLYFSINAQLEQAKIKLNEETPIFAELEPVIIPPIKSKPQTFLVLFLYGALGVIIAAFYALIKFPFEIDSVK